MKMITTEEIIKDKYEWDVEIHARYISLEGLPEDYDVIVDEAYFIIGDEKVKVPEKIRLDIEGSL